MLEQRGCQGLFLALSWLSLSLHVALNARLRFACEDGFVDL
jgi:hypothetical protein